VRIGPDDPVDECGHPRRNGQGSGDIEPAAFRLTSRLRERAKGDDEHRDPDGNVHEQNPAPADEVGEQSARDQPARGAARRGRRPHAQRPAAFVRLGEPGGEQAQRRGSKYRTANALGGAGRDQLPGALRKPAQETEQGESGEPEQEHPLAPEQIGRPTAQHQEPGERERVGVDHPLLAGGRHVKRRAHLRQCDVDDRHVEDDHELSDARNRENGDIRVHTSAASQPAWQSCRHDAHRTPPVLLKVSEGMGSPVPRGARYSVVTINGIALL
jgi:hypothetical protein